MKYCRKCGKKLHDDSLFCDSCGTKVIEFKDGFIENTKHNKNDATYEDKYSYLNKYKHLHELMNEIEDRISDKDYNVAAQKMRSAAEFMARDIYLKNGGMDNSLSFNEILREMKYADVLTAESLDNYHLIRKLGNSVSHGNEIEPDEVKNMYNALKTETVEYAEKYAKVQKENSKLKNSTSGESSFFVRFEGVVEVIIALAWMFWVKPFFGIWGILLGSTLIIYGIYLIITGKDPNAKKRRR